MINPRCCETIAKSRDLKTVGSFFLAACLAFISCGFAAPQAPTAFAAPAATHNAVGYAYAPVHDLPAAATDFVCRPGELCAKRLGNGDLEVMDYAFDAKHNPDAEVDKIWLFGPAPQRKLEASINYRYDKAGRTTGETLASEGERETLDNRYDAAGNLIARSRTDDNDGETEIVRFAYDGNRNVRIEAHVVGGARQETDSEYDGMNRLSAVNGKPETGLYNRRDARLRDRYGNAYRYASDNRTLEADTPTGDYAYRYFPGYPALRAEKRRIGGGGELSYYYAGAGEDATLLAAAEPGGQSAHWLLGADGHEERVATGADDGNGAHYLFTSADGSVRGETGADGRWEHALSYAAYGRQRQVHPHSPFDLDRPLLGFQGNPQDAETGNGYNETRYNNGDSTWTTADSRLTMNRLGAFAADPINNRDDNGELAMPFGLMMSLPGVIASGAELAQADSGEETVRAALGMAANFSGVAGALNMAIGDTIEDEETALAKTEPDGEAPDRLTVGNDDENDKKSATGWWIFGGVAVSLLICWLTWLRSDARIIRLAANGDEGSIDTVIQRGLRQYKPSHNSTSINTSIITEKMPIVDRYTKKVTQDWRATEEVMPDSFVKLKKAIWNNQNNASCYTDSIQALNQETNLVNFIFKRKRLINSADRFYKKTHSNQNNIPPALQQKAEHLYGTINVGNHTEEDKLLKDAILYAKIRGFKYPK